MLTDEAFKVETPEYLSTLRALAQEVCKTFVDRRTAWQEEPAEMSRLLKARPLPDALPVTANTAEQYNSDNEMVIGSSEERAQQFEEETCVLKEKISELLCSRDLIQNELQEAILELERVLGKHRDLSDVVRRIQTETKSFLESVSNEDISRSQDYDVPAYEIVQNVLKMAYVLQKDNQQLQAHICRLEIKVQENKTRYIKDNADLRENAESRHQTSIEQIDAVEDQDRRSRQAMCHTNASRQTNTSCSC